MRINRFLLIPVISALAACSSPSTAPATSGSQPASTSAPAAAAAAPVAASGPAAAGSGPAKKTLVLHEMVNASTYTAKGGSAKPGGPTGEPAEGDVWAFSSVLQQGGRTAGTDHVTITFGAAGIAVVDAVETLATGSIVVHGSAPFQPTLAIPVISGTGSYGGATGTFTIVSKDNTHNDLTIALT